jgi:hypothetical protein
MQTTEEAPRMSIRLLLAALTTLAVALAACDTGPTDVAQEPTPAPDEDPLIESPEADTPETATDDEALERVADAAANTADEGTARFTITVDTEGTGMGDGTQAISAEGEEDFDQQRRRLTFQGPQGDLEMLIDGSTLYFQLPATEDDDWARVELDQLVDADIGFGGPGGLPFQSPHNNLVLLEDTAVRASEAGSETIDGEDTTRYDVTLDLTAAAEQTEDTTNTRGQLEDTVRQLGAEELEMSVWVDSDERIRRIAYTLDLDQVRVDEEASTDTPDADVDAEVEADPAGEVTVTVDYHEFGGTVDVDLPDSDQVIDIDEEELRRSFQGSES